MAQEVKPTYIVISCPYCKQCYREYFYDSKQEKEGHYCEYCGEVSVFTKQLSFADRRNGKKYLKLKMMNDKEAEYFFSDEPNGRFTSAEHPDWLAAIKKKDTQFEVVILENGVYNPYHDDFMEFERQARVQFLQTGIIPIPGDHVQANGKKDEHKGHVYGKEYVIVGRGFWVNDFDTIQLYVVTQERWLQKNGW